MSLRSDFEVQEFTTDGLRELINNVGVGDRWMDVCGLSVKFSSLIAAGWNLRIVDKNRFGGRTLITFYKPGRASTINFKLPWLKYQRTPLEVLHELSLNCVSDNIAQSGDICNKPKVIEQLSPLVLKLESATDMELLEQLNTNAKKRRVQAVSKSAKRKVPEPVIERALRVMSAVS